MAHRLSREARTDLDDVWLYIASHRNIEAADRVVDAIIARFLLLSRYPRAGRQRDDLRPGTRAFPVGDYLVLYRLDGSDILIQRVIRGSRDLDVLQVE
jgi:toxin ParE1/3/4